MRLAKAVVLVASLASACAVTTPLMAADFTVQITNTGGTTFQPSSLTINAGDRVNWRNRSSLQHTATSGTGCTGNGIFDTGFMNPNTTSAFVTFNTPGTYPYICIVHCTVMTGTIIVQAPPVPTQNRTWGGVKALYRTNG